ncbi:hypothetical protein PIIN_04523 [Serendipita indica DSM 11827]|uniref:Uncharacterized protein n=1 Tax=Serendipita indica (strain DSM 11827) TaxID=1109443 RepID=G4TGZ2_SERID|nr:hypothetical protein PIIN_04523 [Serendipita indica DSM 11827]
MKHLRNDNYHQSSGTLNSMWPCTRPLVTTGSIQTLAERRNVRKALQREIDILEHIGDLRRVTIDEGVDELEPVPLTNQEASMEESEVVSLLGVDSINVEETVMPYDTSSDTPSMDSWYYSATESIFHPLDPS